MNHRTRPLLLILVAIALFWIVDRDDDHASRAPQTQRERAHGIVSRIAWEAPSLPGVPGVEATAPWVAPDLPWIKTRAPDADGFLPFDEYDYAGPVSNEPGTLRGRVEIDGKPATDFWVIGNLAPRHYSSPTGEFELELPGNVSWKVYVVADGTTVAVEWFSVRPHQARDVVFELATSDTVTGLVLDRHGVPVSGAEVTLTQENYGVWHTASPRRSRTDASGRFEIASYGGAEKVFVVSALGNGTSTVDATGTAMVRLVSADELPLY